MHNLNALKFTHVSCTGLKSFTKFIELGGHLCNAVLEHFHRSYMVKP